jgi:pyrimidine operon attenuation protein/uracil phosphoribosyltransferase
MPDVTGLEDATSLARQVLDADQISRACARMAHEVLEANRGPAGLVLLGIPTRGSGGGAGRRGTW